MYEKKSKTIEVVVTLSPKQIKAIFERHPEELSFTKKLVMWDLTGRKNTKIRAKRLEADRDALFITPQYETVPSFTLKAK